MARLQTIFLSSITLHLANAALLFLTGVLLANWLGPENFGVYTLIISAASVVGIPINSGLPVLLTRETAKFYKSQNLSAWKGLLNFALLVVVLVWLLGGLILGIYYVLYGIPDTNNIYFLLLILLLVPIISLDRLRGSVMQGLGHPILSQLPESLVRPITYFLALGIGVLFYTGSSINYVMASYVFAAILSFFYGSVLLRKVIGIKLKNIIPIYTAKIWIFALFSLGSLSASQMFVGNADILLLGFLGETAEVGVYKVSLQGVALMLISQTGISAVLSSKFSQSFAANDIKEVVRVSDKSVVLFSATSACIFISFLFLGEKFISLFFKEYYLGAVSTLIILSSGQFVNSITGPSMTILVMSRNERVALAAVSAGGSSMFILALLLIPRYGGMGMAVSSSVGVTLTNIIMAFGVKRKIGFDPSLLGAVWRFVGCRG